MTKEAQQIAIALTLGAKWYLFDSGYSWLSFGDLSKNSGPRFWKLVSEPIDPSKILIRDSIPDYLNDLNAMHEAEKALGDETRWFDYSAWLCNILNRDTDGHEHVFEFHTTAAQRAEAFLRTTELWNDTK